MRDRTAGAIATVLGVGRSPVAPGTAGTLVAVPLFWLLSRGGLPLELLGLAAVVFAGVPAAGRVAALTGAKDPQVVVVDEVAGFLLAMLGHPAAFLPLLEGFVLFRLFDIVKPFPIRRLERLPGGWGIVADDLAAGGYAWACLFLLRKAVGP